MVPESRARERPRRMTRHGQRLHSGRGREEIPRWPPWPTTL
jgi:hypothetical protein